MNPWGHMNPTIWLFIYNLANNVNPSIPSVITVIIQSKNDMIILIWDVDTSGADT